MTEPTPKVPPFVSVAFYPAYETPSVKSCGRYVALGDDGRAYVLMMNSEPSWALLGESSYALAQPAPEPPTDDELNELWNMCGTGDEYGHHEGNIFQYARAVLARWGQTRPAPEPPTDEELQALWIDGNWYNEGATPREFMSIARAVLARWGQGNG